MSFGYKPQTINGYELSCYSLSYTWHLSFGVLDFVARGVAALVLRNLCLQPDCVTF